MSKYIALAFVLVNAACSAAFDCALPDNADKYSVITRGDATVGAHSIYKGLAIGGTLFDGAPNQSATVDKFTSYVNKLDSNNKFNFNEGVQKGKTVDHSMIEQFEYLAKHAQSSKIDGKKVVVVKSGGTYNMYDFNNGGQGEDNGNTVVIFNTEEDIVITKTSDGRQFGPSIIAPFAKVSVRGDAGYVDGFVMAKSFETKGGNQGQLQLHGDTYSGGFECSSAVDPVPAAGPKVTATANDLGQAVKGSDTAQAPPTDKSLPTTAQTSVKPDLSPSDKCIETNWKEAGNTEELLCSTRDVYLESGSSDKPVQCSVGETVKLTVDGSIRFRDLIPRYDLAWYVATDGGDAMTGKCAATGLTKAFNDYSVVAFPGSDKVVGSVVWDASSDGDDDVCGDVVISSNCTDTANLDTPFIVDMELPCADDNEDGLLDFAVCFTWRQDCNNGVCSFDAIIPGNPTTGCYCTRVDISNTEVDDPQPVEPC